MMKNFKEIKGNMINLSHKGYFDVVLHGANCFCTMGAGLAPQMAKAYSAHTFPMEAEEYKGDINKLGTIDYEYLYLQENSRGIAKWMLYPDEQVKTLRKLIVVNCYTQYGYGRNHLNGAEKPIDYEALTLCMRKINATFMGKRIGVPHIGSDLAGGDINIIREIVKRELKDCQVTFIEFNGEPTVYEYKPKYLFLDDVRIPKDVLNYKKNKLYGLEHWQIVRNYEEFVNWIEENGLPDVVSFDHDLHESHYTPKEYWDDFSKSLEYQTIKKQNYTVPTGEACAEYFFNKMSIENVFPKILIHTQNPVGEMWIKKIFEK